MQIKKDKKGNITMEIQNLNRNFYLHSKYDVYKEAQKFSNNFLKKSKEINILYGFGLGYHIKEILKVLKDNQKLYILELRKDIFDFAKENIELQDIFSDKRIKLIVKEDYMDLVLEFKRLNLKIDNSKLFIHEPSINAIKEKNIKFKEILDELKVNKRVIVDSKMTENMQKNLKLNKELNDEGISIFFDEFKNIPGIMICAGPSLDYLVDKLKYFKNKSLMFCVGRTLRVFKEFDYKPDMFIITEQSDNTRVQIKEFENFNIPFIYLMLASNKTVSAYKGPRFYFYSDSSDIKSENVLKVKSSVASAGLSMLIKMGCNPIIFVGQDLGFYDKEHSSKVIYEGYLQNKFDINYKYTTVKNVFGDNINTNKGYNSMRLFMEKIIRENNHIEFINASYKGANIEGAKYMDIDEVYEKYIKNLSFDIEDKLNYIIKNK